MSSEPPTKSKLHSGLWLCDGAGAQMMTQDLAWVKALSLLQWRVVAVLEALRGSLFSGPT